MTTHSVRRSDQSWSDKSASAELKILKKLCKGLDTPRSLAIFICLKHGDVKSALSFDIDPLNYNDPFRFRDDYLVTKLLSKSENINVGIDTEAAAFHKWLESEQMCRDTNERLDAYVDGRLQPLRPKITSIIIKARELLSLWLGPLTRNTLTQVERHMDFGPGATTGVTRVVTRGKKFSCRSLTTTQRLLSFGMFCLPVTWRRNIQGFTIRESSKMSFVPKNFKTMRAINIDNDLNIYVQKGIGSVLKLKLKNIGIDLSTQEVRNQQLAQKAFKADLATIDLSSASDTISYNTVSFMFPHEWKELFDLARTDFTSYQGVDYRLEKYSAMGNGYTFELETLLFYSIVQACKALNGSDRETAAYGDDLICGCDIMSDVIDTLNFLGFSVNREKTFGKSLFHESCGSDFFEGINVRPVFFKGTTTDKHDFVQKSFLYVNQLRYWSGRNTSGLSCDVRVLPAWLFGVSLIEKPFRTIVPNYDYADSGIVDNWDKASPSLVRAGEGWGGYFFRRYLRPPVTSQVDVYGAYLSTLASKGPSDIATNGRESLRGRKKSLHSVKGYTFDWISLGPWL